MIGWAPVKVATPCNWAKEPSTTDWSGPAFTAGAPGERGPSSGPVVRMTSKLVMLILVRSLKQFAGQRSSGVTEIEKKFPLSATQCVPINRVNHVSQIEPLVGSTMML